MALYTFQLKKFVFSILILLGATLQESRAQVVAVHQRATIYSLPDQKGSSIVLNQASAADLRVLSFDNQAKSICVTGTWIVYENINYNNLTIGLHQHIFGQDNYCTNLDATISGKVSSIRYVGLASDYRANTTTLYQGLFFQGAQELIQADKPNLILDLKVSSFVITGTSAWTYYTLPGYLGVKKCVTPPYPSSTIKFSPAFVGNPPLLGISINTVRSVRKGCF